MAAVPYSPLCPRLLSWFNREHASKVRGQGNNYQRQRRRASFYKDVTLLEGDGRVGGVEVMKDSDVTNIRTRDQADLRTNVSAAHCSFSVDGFVGEGDVFVLLFGGIPCALCYLCLVLLRREKCKRDACSSACQSLVDRFPLLFFEVGYERLLLSKRECLISMSLSIDRC